MLHHKPVSQPADGLDVDGPCGVRLDLLAQAADIHHDGVLIHDGGAPYHVVDHIFGENAVHIVQKQLHDGVFLGGEHDLRPILIKSQRACVVAEGSGGDDASGAGQPAPAAPDESLDLGPQGDGVEGLGQIVVRADIQAVEGVVVLLAPADDDDGQLHPPVPERLNHLEAVHPRHVHVQQHEIIAALPGHLNGFPAATGCVGVDAAALHHLAEHGQHRLVVVHDQHRVRHLARPLYR